MSSVGTVLRKSRLDQGISLQDISVRTRISVKKLEAIEADDLGQFSSPFVYRSFVRQFAAELNLHYDLLAVDVMAACETMRQPLLPGEGNAPVIRVAPLRPKFRSDSQWMYLTAALVLVIVAGSGAYAVWIRANPGLGVVNLSTNLSSPVRQESKLAPVPAAAPSAIARLPREADSGIHIRLSAIETTWLSIVADGKQTYSGILEASQTKVLEGRETARIKTGNAGGVTIVFNGKELGPMGRHGETRTVLFTKTGYEVVRSAAEVLIPALFSPHRGLPLSQIVE